MTLDAREPLFPYCYAIEKSRRGDVDGAFKLYERTIQVDPTFAQAHCNLASILQSRGRFEEALESYTRGHELSARKPDWNYPSAWWVERTRRIVDLSKQKTPPRLEAAALKEGVSGLSLLAVVLCLLIVTGCSQGNGDADSTAAKGEAGHEHGEEGHDHGEEGHSLHGYWCVEHGMPEEVCAQCNTKLASTFQEKGDWCEEHGRPDSQCFIHHPELEEKFIAQYEAKFGEKPPAREVE